MKPDDSDTAIKKSETELDEKSDKCAIFNIAHCALTATQRANRTQCENCELGREMDMTEND